MASVAYVLQTSIQGSGVFLAVFPDAHPTDSTFTFDWGDGSKPMTAYAYGAFREVAVGTYTAHASWTDLTGYHNVQVQYTVHEFAPQYRLLIEVTRGGVVISTQSLYRPLHLADPPTQFVIPVQAGDYVGYRLQELACGGEYQDSFVNSYRTDASATEVDVVFDSNLAS